MITIKAGSYNRYDMNRLLEGFLELRQYYKKYCCSECQKCLTKNSCADINRAIAYLLNSTAEYQTSITKQN